jgi:hypothetical protein
MRGLVEEAQQEALAGDEGEEGGRAGARAGTRRRAASLRFSDLSAALGW